MELLLLTYSTDDGLIKSNLVLGRILNRLSAGDFFVIVDGVLRYVNKKLNSLDNINFL